MKKSSMEDYVKRFFSEQGYNDLKNYVRNLVKLYHTEEKYPIKLGFILGIPNFKYAQNIYSKEQLRERIKAYMHILGIQEIEAKNKKGYFIRLRFGG